MNKSCFTTHQSVKFHTLIVYNFPYLHV